MIKEFSNWLINLFLTSGYEMGDLQDQVDNLKDPMEVRTMFSATLEKYGEKCKLEGKKEIAQEMVQMGMPVETIVRVTGLSLEAIRGMKSKV